MDDLQPMQVETFRFLRNVANIASHQMHEASIILKIRPMILSTNPFESRSFLYLDIASWLESKISNVPVQDVMKRKFLRMK